MRHVQFVGNNTAWNDSYVGEQREITVDIQTEELRLHDGFTPGGKKIPNVDTVPTLERKVFTNVDTKTPGNFLAAEMDKLLTLSTSGTYILPDRELVGLAVGKHLILYATVTGVVIEPYTAGQAIRDKGSLLTTRALNQYETLHLALVAVAGSFAWHVLSSY